MLVHQIYDSFGLINLNLQRKLLSCKCFSLKGRLPEKCGLCQEWSHNVWVHVWCWTSIFQVTYIYIYPKAQRYTLAIYIIKRKKKGYHSSRISTFSFLLGITSHTNWASTVSHALTSWSLKKVSRGIKQLGLKKWNISDSYCIYAYPWELVDTSCLVLSGQPSLIAFTVCTDVLHVTKREVQDGLFNHIKSSFLSHAFSTVIGMATSTVPVTLYGFGIKC